MPRRRPDPALKAAITGLLALALIVTSLLFGPGDEPLAAAQASETVSNHPAQRGGNSPCVCGSERAIESTSIRSCDTTAVTLTLTPGCPGTPIHIVLIIDEVYKPNFSEPRDRVDALRQSVLRLELEDNPHIRVGVVWMQDGKATDRVALTNEPQQVISNLDIPPVSRFAAAQQCFECGYRQAVRMLDRARRDHDNRVEPYEITILAPLGIYTPQAAPGVIRGANMVKARQAQSITTCFAWTHCDNALRQAASTARLYLGYGEGNRLAATLHGVVQASVETLIRSLEVHELLPAGMELITDSVKPDPESIDSEAGRITWSFPGPEEPVYTLTYRLAAQELGTWDVTGGWSELRDSRSRVVSDSLPAGAITVGVECPMATPLPTTPPSPTPSPTTPATAVPTATPSPTATRRPEPIFLPIAINEQCKSKVLRADIALVFDMSTSMRQPAANGSPKVDSVLAAGLAFLDGLTLSSGSGADDDRVAIVGFNREAWIQVPLTSDRSALESGLGALPGQMQEHTRLDLAFLRGFDGLGLTGDGAGDGASEREQAIIVLTDGMPNQVPYAEDGTVETTVLRAAARAKLEGVTVYTIGVGRADGPAPEINAALLEAAASSPAHYYEAPDAGELHGVYADLSRVLPCGGATYWPAEGR